MSDRLIPFTQWLDRLRILRLPLDIPPPREYQTYGAWRCTIRGVEPATGQTLKSYADWVLERGRLGLPLDAPAPSGYESYSDWFRRVRGLDPKTGERLTSLNDPLVNRPEWSEGYRPNRPSGSAEAPRAQVSPQQSVSPGNTSAAPSSFARRALLATGDVAGRLGAIGAAIRNVLPVLGAVSTVIHAVREGRDQQSAPMGEESRPRADVTPPARPKFSKREPNGSPSNLSSWPDA